MRYAGLCSILLMILAACDDAVGSAHPGDIASPEENMMETADTPAVGTSDDAGESAEERAASLGLTQEIDFTCDQADMSAHIVLYGSEEVAAVLIPGKVNVPLYLDCSPTRIGPECTDGQFTALLNTLEDKVVFSDPTDASPLTCSMVQPELPPDME